MKSPYSQPERKSIRKQALRRSTRIPNKVPTLKNFAPLRITGVGPSTTKEKWLRVAVEGNFKVERALSGGPDNIFDRYYRHNTNKHHVWTDHLVIRNETDLDMTLPDVTALGVRDLMKFNLDCLDDPENHFYLIKLGDPMGLGLFAKHAIPANSIIGEYTGELISTEEWQKRNGEMDRTGAGNYFYETCSSLTIDAGAMGNHTRFINHDCEDLLNCRAELAVVGNIPRNFIVSNETIEKNEQLFLSYGEEYFNNLKCLCRSKNCVSKKKTGKR